MLELLEEIVDIDNFGQGIEFAAGCLLLFARNIESLDFYSDSAGASFLLFIMAEANWTQRSAASESRPALRSLEQICIRGEHNEHVAMVDLRTVLEIPSLRKAIRAGFAVENGEMKLDLQHHSQVEELYLDDCKIDTGSMSLITPQFPKLKILELTYRNRYPDTRLDATDLFKSLAHVHNTLECLSIIESSPKRARMMNYHQLSLPTFSHFTQLKSLTLSAFFLDYLFHDPVTPEAAPHVFNFGIFPPNLEDLALCGVDESAVALLHVMADRELAVTLPELYSVHIELSDELWRDYTHMESRCSRFIPQFGRMGIMLSVDAGRPATKAANQEGRKLVANCF